MARDRNVAIENFNLSWELTPSALPESKTSAQCCFNLASFYNSMISMIWKEYPYCELLMALFPWRVSVLSQSCSGYTASNVYPNTAPAQVYKVGECTDCMLCLSYQ